MASRYGGPRAPSGWRAIHSMKWRCDSSRSRRTMGVAARPVGGDHAQLNDGRAARLGRRLVEPGQQPLAARLHAGFSHRLRQRQRAVPKSCLVMIIGSAAPSTISHVAVGEQVDQAWGHR